MHKQKYNIAKASGSPHKNIRNTLRYVKFSKAHYILFTVRISDMMN